MTPILVFDIETVPDVEGIRQIFDLPAELDDADVCEWFAQKRRGASGSDFAPQYLQQVVAIACALRTDNDLNVWSIGEVDDPEPELIRRFFDGIEKLTPQLVSWNGGGFDLPVLQHRALIHGVAGERYWDWGDQDHDFKYNSYLGRYHTRHLDLMDVLAMYQPRAKRRARRDRAAVRLPRQARHGRQRGRRRSRARRAAGRAQLLRDGRAQHVLLYQRFRLMRGELSAGEYAKEIALVREKIAATDAPHWKAFVAAWDAG